MEEYEVVKNQFTTRVASRGVTAAYLARGRCTCHRLPSTVSQPDNLFRVDFGPLELPWSGSWGTVMVQGLCRVSMESRRDLHSEQI
jgi:hypothetical protein